MYMEQIIWYFPTIWNLFRREREECGHDIGCLLDSFLFSLSMEAQVTNVARSALFLFCQIKQLVPYLSSSDLATMTHAMVISRLDYCNSLYSGLSLRMIQKLELLQNTAACVLAGAP